jgi:hypothetical protein
MKKQTLAWVLGGTIFAAIVGVWIWQLPNIIKNTAKGTDNGLSGIVSAFQGNKNDVAADLLKTKAQIEQNMLKFNRAMAGEEAKASTISALKAKISEQAIKAATVPEADIDQKSNTNANVPGLPATPNKPSAKK